MKNLQLEKLISELSAKAQKPEMENDLEIEDLILN
jgi:hypothetical protein